MAGLDMVVDHVRNQVEQVAIRVPAHLRANEVTVETQNSTYVIVTTYLCNGYTEEASKVSLLHCTRGTFEGSTWPIYTSDLMDDEVQVGGYLTGDHIDRSGSYSTTRIRSIRGRSLI